MDAEAENSGLLKPCESGKRNPSAGCDTKRPPSCVYWARETDPKRRCSDESYSTYNSARSLSLRRASVPAVVRSRGRPVKRCRCRSSLTQRAWGDDAEVGPALLRHEVRRSVAPDTASNRSTASSPRWAVLRESRASRQRPFLSADGMLRGEGIVPAHRQA